tara:strand:+ start:217 stop:807 length:591 start_codon:yes stop_codon:yes gene_type:complete
MERQGDSTTYHEMEATIASTAVVGVDLQPVFLDLVTNGEKLRERCALLLESAALTGMRVYLTEQVPEKLGGFDKDLTALVPNAPRFAKSTFSAFGAEGFENALRTDGIEHLLLAGLETTICVYQTALDARRSGLAVTILTDCVSCRRPADEKWALGSLRDAGCHVLPVETIFYALISTAKNPLFRKFSKLIQKFDP